MQPTLDRPILADPPPPATPGADDWYRQEVPAVLAALSTDSGGLDDANVTNRRSQYGANELVEKGARSPLAIIWEQFTNVMVLILIGAAGLSLVLGKFIEAGAILAIVVLFAILGFIQEYRAEKAIAALKKLAVPSVRVYRSGRLQEISARDLVPGDVIALEAGNLVPADIRIIESINLRIQEAALTGESEPIEKETLAIDRAELPLGDRRNMGYVEEGRVIYDNLRRFVKFAVAGNIGKVLVMLLWPVLFFFTGLPLEAAVALLPLQLLWLNLMTDGLLGLSMGIEPAEQNVMRRPPHRPTDGIFSGGMGWQVAWVGIAIGVITLGVGFWYYHSGQAQWQAMMFTTLAVLQVFQALATRSNRESLFTIGMFSNRVMWGVIALVVSLQLAALYTPLGVFPGLQPLTAADLLISVALGAALFAMVEIEKLVLRLRGGTHGRAVLAQSR